MRRRTLAVLAMVIVLAGCGTARPAPSASPTDPAAGRAAGPTPRGCAAPGPTVTVTPADNGGTVCLTAGGVLTLALTGAGWRPPQIHGDALKADGPQRFTSVRAGKASLSSAHPNCPTGTNTCHSLQAFSVQVVVS